MSADRLPPVLYFALWDLLGPLLLNSLNFAIKLGSFHRDQNTALISLIFFKKNLKKGRTRFTALVIHRFHSFVQMSRIMLRLFLVV